MLSTNPPLDQHPPAYSEVDPTPGSDQRPPELHTYRPDFFAHTSPGPTPLTTQPLIPYAYYDARSPYSITQADIRARWRLISGCLWASGLWTVIGLVVGVELTEYGATRAGATTWLLEVLSSFKMG
ncbi:hypothetical protein BDZ94DRAFT_1255319 [Collybia nuda]|uniref:Uncharacterized protein n=1 Tax=Collybia nuda TaxID=64659 RepID=A0A9P6CJY8_9AGAR|nr:hypothetical protein BDZ94DRAFT_1255319 [Collybia nuda]